MLEGIPPGARLLFRPQLLSPCRRERGDVIAETEYGGIRFASVLGRDNLVACQFHAEKSGKWGLRLLEELLQVEWPDGIPPGTAMLTKRLIVCLDVRNGKVTKGIKFQGNVDLGDPVEMGRAILRSGRGRAGVLRYHGLRRGAAHRHRHGALGGPQGVHPLLRGRRHPQPGGHAARCSWPGPRR